MNRLFVFLAVAGLFCQSGVSFAKDKVRIATGEWLPYVSAQHKHHGALAHIISEAFALSDVDVEYGYFPWTRGYQLVQEGDWDAAMPYYCSDERAAAAYCSDPLVDGEQVFFYLKDTPFTWEKMADLRDIPIGATLGYYYGEAFEKAEQQGLLTVRRIAKDETNFHLLLKGRIRLFPQDKEVGYSLIKNVLPADQQDLVTHHPRPIHTKPLHVLFPKHKPRSEHLLKLFNEGLAKLKQQGVVRQRLQDMRAGLYQKQAYVLQND